MNFKLLLAAGISGFALTLAATAAAQTADTGADDAEAIKTAAEIVVQAQIGFRNRSEDTEPKLVYDTDYFQRFEPLTAGDALKRVPSVTFLSDVIESDGARLRGLDPGYTQILINGEKVPGSNADRSFFLDRIPAELISRVEIVRSSSARRTGDAVAGTLNIVLRDGYELDGGYVRGGALRFRNDKVVPSVGAVYGGAIGESRILLGANVQGRYNPKLKTSLRYSDSPENNPNYATDDFVNREDQTDTRDGMDYAFNATWGLNTGGTDVELSAFYVRNDRKESERSFEYDDPTAVTGSVRGTPAGNLLTDNANVNDIQQDNYSLAGKLKQEWALGKTSLKLGFARFIDRQDETEFEVDFDRAAPRFTGDLTETHIDDRELSLSLDHQFDIGANADIVIGGFLQNKDRDTDIRTIRQRFNLPASVHGWNQFSENPTGFARQFDPSAPEPGSVNRVEEDRRDAFALIEGKSGAFAWEAGLRYESTRVRIEDQTVAPALATQRNDYDILLPSASLKIDVTPSDRITLSAARTNRRPRLDYISPARLLAELGDNDLQGNPDLRAETAWGGDAGYEHRIGSTGVVGINFFYRNITNLIELANTGEEGSEGSGTFVLQPRNTGDGNVYGVEFDLSTDLRFIGMKDTGIFGNFSYLESDIDDEFGSRRFNGQSKYVFNVGFIQNLPSYGAAFGATYRKQGGAFDRTVGEEVTTNYGGDLEIFVEKRFGDSVTVRAVGSNLLDGHKDEVFNKFTTIEDQTDRIFDEYEIESERAGPVFQLMARVAF
ncbi:outer membrane receptor for ferrienterochelin and colicin [Sphingomonas naasensis]|uniref:TonB-dependent receptor n=1 Tax=Sphingomonas naasensis TaxID=1344951 RepID=A0A4S1W8U2_9SPHN|nr:TonB-dependent receptor [Sphingomonas naasensis]NIJ19580.1 outer membrane receptor for ferrienterochelin and colicin [Sphingomonas naasensis]TGX39311.1 TonB-dependent receptor [Sphingomonas naasensis]